MAKKMMAFDDIADVVRVSQLSGGDEWIDYLGQENCDFIVENFSLLNVSLDGKKGKTVRQQLSEAPIARKKLNEFFDNYKPNKDKIDDNLSAHDEYEAKKRVYEEVSASKDLIEQIQSEPVEARVGQVGERVLTTLKTTYEGKGYILSEVENEVKETEMEDGTKQPDIIVTNTHSTSNEEYIVRANKFPKMYSANTDGTFTPAPEPRPVAKLSEDVVIETSWGEMAVGLKGSYIVTYDVERQSYNTIEQGAFESTYTIQDGLNKQL